MVNQAPLVLAFCADRFRTRQWLAQRGARPGFADFIRWHVAAFDAIILAQTTALALQSQGRGICDMGTTLHSMGEIADFLKCPENCLPATPYDPARWRLPAASISQVPPRGAGAAPARPGRAAAVPAPSSIPLPGARSQSRSR